MGYRHLDGVACDRAPDGIWPERFGRFLYDLHSVPPEFVGLRAVRAGTLRDRIWGTWDALAAEVLPLMDHQDRSSAERMLAATREDDDLWAFAPCLIHGDLGPEHVLVGPDGDLAGVLDWEEAAIGDPAWDFAWWLHELSGPAERALAAYGGAPDRRFRDRARLAHAIAPWHEVVHGLRTGEAAFVASGLEGARRRLPRSS
jgi:aminoglycoside 2''-phosphotransferase